LIRRILESGYNKTVGALLVFLSDRLTSLTRGGNLFQLLYVLLVVGLMAGFINAVFFPVPNQGYIVWPGGGAQTIPEALIDAFVIMVGGAGIYMAYVSGRQTTRPRTVNLYLGLALLLIAVSVLAGIEIAIIKGFG
jgi:hypothetical protein